MGPKGVGPGLAHMGKASSRIAFVCPNRPKTEAFRHWGALRKCPQLKVYPGFAGPHPQKSVISSPVEMLGGVSSLSILGSIHSSILPGKSTHLQNIDINSAQVDALAVGARSVLQNEVGTG